jgi:hypothetical protein
VKWLIADQISGDPELHSANGVVGTPWIAWGKYVCSDGVKPDKDGLNYAAED